MKDSFYPELTRNGITVALTKHLLHFSLVTILFQLTSKASDRPTLAGQTPTGTDSATQHTASPRRPEKHSIQGQVVVLALQSASRTRLVISASGKNGQSILEFVMTSESHATPGLTKGADVIVTYHDHKENRKKVHLVSFVRVVAPSIPIPAKPGAAPEPTTSPPNKYRSPLSAEQGAVAQNIPGVFEENWRPSYEGGGGSFGSLIGGLTGGGKGAAIGAAVGSAGGTKGGTASTASGQSVTSGKTGATTGQASGGGSTERRIKTVSGKVLSWGAEYLLLDAKDDKTSTNQILIFITDDSEFEKDVSLNDQVVVTYRSKQGENIATDVKTYSKQ